MTDSPIKTHTNTKLPVYRLEKPDLSKINTAKTLNNYLNSFNEEVEKKFEEVSETDYLYWDKIKRKLPPTGFTSVEFWFVVKQLRKLRNKPVPIKAENGAFFSLGRLKSTDEHLHKIDMRTGGQVFAPYEVLTEKTKQKFVSRGIIEEAIASSQLEGATTTGPVAKKLILENRTPRNISETMILNNYKTMKMIDEEYKKKKLTKELLFEIHYSLTQGQVEREQQYRYRVNADEIEVSNDEYIAHIPPKEVFLNQEMERLLAYANDEEDDGFVHPVIKAILLHFWIGYLHPFTDGNGRLARGLFYWYLLKKGYWTFMYLPISTIIKKSPDQYARSYILSEQDDLDVTYFFDYHIRKIVQATKEFNNYVDRVTKENKEVDEIVGRETSLNERQKQVVHHLLAERGTSYATIQTHAVVNRVGRLTARKDLVELSEIGLLVAQKVGKVVRYFPSKKLLRLSQD